ncbi:UNVERIFIED_CONTAM: L-ascorbate peroxidase 1, cytosolic [Sesamum latifolium]|uniref:L-ascorbate peroxidase 1, cytosolic n=1 Tax=Sesamum latifolium TaxID=2727402 RepID=A0AAW2Y3N4_9LAMI
MVKNHPKVSEEYLKAVEKCKKKLRGFIAFKHFAPLRLRLVWHSAGTFDMSSKTGGPFGTIRLKTEKGHTANNGIEIAARLLEPIKEQFPMLSYADFYQLLEDLKFHFTLEGREDATRTVQDMRDHGQLTVSSLTTLTLLRLLTASFWVEIKKALYEVAMDEDAFFPDYAVSHMKLSELGFAEA